MSAESDNDIPHAVIWSSGAYTIQLPVYDGPLELLLHLIRRDEFDIFDIPIGELTGSYLSSLKEMRSYGIEPASDFLVMAATLLQLKSRMLIPRPVDEHGEEIPHDDPRADLVRQLLEYQAFREVAAALDEVPRLGRDVFLRPTGQDRPKDPEEQLSSLDAYRLAQAFRALTKRSNYQAPHEIYVERITIGERMAQIGDRLALRGRLSFAALCIETKSTEEVITTFLALLEMARLRLIRCIQRQERSPLYIESRVDEIDVLGERAAGMLAET